MVPHISNALNLPVRFIPSCIGTEVEEEISNANFSSDASIIVLLENVRFHSEELSLYLREMEYLNEENLVEKKSNDKNHKNDKEKEAELERYHSYSEMTEEEKVFCDAISSYGDYFVNDCLSECNTKASSIIGINPGGGRVAGPLLAKSLDLCSKIIENPRQPIRAIISGDPNAETLQLLKGLVSIVDEVLLGKCEKKLRLISFIYFKTILYYYCIVGGEIANIMACCLSVKPLNELHANPITEELKSTFLSINKLALLRSCPIVLPPDF